MRRAWPAALAALAAALALPGAAAASRVQEAMFQDDAELVYPPRDEVARSLDTLQALGVDRIRVSVYWRLVAPNAASEQRPGFGGGGESDPAAYPRENWRRYDDLLRLAYDRGIQVNFDVTGPAPEWASAGMDGIAFPDAAAFGQFTRAVATRYSGSYTPPPENRNPPPPPPPNPDPLPFPLPAGAAATQQQQPQGAVSQASDATLPRVVYWSFFNEGNQRVFLYPQYQGGFESSPRIYRDLFDAAWRALQDTGHGTDTVLVGETAPKGGNARDPAANMRPLRFIRALYCVNAALLPVTGRAAQALGCPERSQRGAMPAQHPGLFQATGYAHHPYALLTPPALRARNRDDVALADLPRLQSTLGRIFAIYGQRRRLPIFNTEFGYQSRPPDPYGFPQHLAAAYINQGEYMQYVNPRVRSAHQFLLVDAPPETRYPSNSFLYWSSFQTGLIARGGGAKPAFNAYRIPLFIPAARRRRGGSFRIWGCVRPAPNGSAQRVQIQFRRLGARAPWRTIRTVTTRSSRNYVDTRVRLTRSGTVRLSWRNPATGETLLSRLAGVRIGR